MFTVEPVAGVPAEQVREMFLWLDDVREGGKVNMFGAAPYLAEMFALDKGTARKVCVAWAETFAARHGSPS